MIRALLAAVLDDRVVVLDSHHARVMLLDPRTEQIWRACTGLRTDEVAERLGVAPPDIVPALDELAEAGLIVSERNCWSQTPVTWV